MNVEVAPGAATRPWMPPGRMVTLVDGNRLFVRDSGGSGPVVVLLHGWMATADLNFGFGYATLSERFRVVAFDQHGHGRGVRNRRRRFGFDGCADDAAAVLDALGIDRAIVVGYSMGGTVAMRFAYRHPDRTDGLVLCATAGAFTNSELRRRLLGSLAPVIDLTRLVPETGLRRIGRRWLIDNRVNGPHAAWISDELVESDIAAIAQAGIALAGFDGHDWIGRIDTPAVSVVTVDDTLVAPTAQHRLAETVGARQIFEVTGGHIACFDRPHQFTPALLAACETVAAGTDAPVRC